MTTELAAIPLPLPLRLRRLILSLRGLIIAKQSGRAMFYKSPPVFLVSLTFISYRRTRWAKLLISTGVKMDISAPDALLKASIFRCLLFNTSSSTAVFSLKPYHLQLVCLVKPLDAVLTGTQVTIGNRSAKDFWARVVCLCL